MWLHDLGPGRSMSPQPISPLGRRVFSPFGRRLDDSPTLVGSPGIVSLPPYPRVDSSAPQDNYSKALQSFERDAAAADAAIGSALVALDEAAHNYSAAMQKRDDNEHNLIHAKQATCRLEEVATYHQANLCVLQRALQAAQESKTQAQVVAEKAGRQFVSDEASEKESRAGVETTKQQYEESIKAMQVAHEAVERAEVELVKAQQEECEALQEADDALAIKACANETKTKCQILADQTAALAVEAQLSAQHQSRMYRDMSGLAYAAHAESNSSMSKQNMLKAEMDSFLKDAMADEAQEIANSTTKERTTRQQDLEEKVMRYRAAAEKERSNYVALCEWKQKHDEAVCNLQRSRLEDGFAGQNYEHCKLEFDKRENEEKDVSQVCERATADVEEARKTMQLSMESCEQAYTLCAESGREFARQRQRFIHARNNSSRFLDFEKLRRYDDALIRLDEQVSFQGPTSPSQNYWPLVVD